MLVGNVVTASYVDDTATRTISATAGNAGAITVSNAEGGVITLNTQSLSVTLTDPDLNANTGTIQTYPTGSEFVLTYQRGISTFPVTIVETGTNTGVFTGIINFHPTTTALSQCTSAITVSPQCTVPRLLSTAPGSTTLAWDGRASLEYWDPDIPAGGRVRGTTENRVRVYLAPGSNATMTASPTVLVGGSYVYITVTDQDRSADEYSAETLSVQVTSSRSGEMMQTVTCTETGIQSATFTGTLLTYLQSETNTATAGYMHVSNGDTLTVSYADFPRYDVGAAVTLTRIIPVVGWYSCRGGSYAQQSCNSLTDTVTCGDIQTSTCVASIGELRAGSAVRGGSNVLVGERLQITVVDMDQNLDSSSAESVNVTVESLQVRVQEFGTQSVWSVLTRVLCLHLFVHPVSCCFFACIQMLVSKMFGKLQRKDSCTLSKSHTPTSSLFLSRHTTSINTHLFARARAHTHTHIHTHTHTHAHTHAHFPQIPDRESVILRESGPNTGLFTGVLPTYTTSSGVGTNEDSRLAVAPSSQITLEYDDTIPIISVVSTMSILNAVVGTVSVSPLRARVGMPVTVTVNDTDLNGNALAQDTVQVTYLHVNHVSSKHVLLFAPCQLFPLSRWGLKITP